MFSVRDFPTSGVNCDTPEIRGLLMECLREKLSEMQVAYHRIGGIPLDWRSPLQGQVLAFYCDKRPKALIQCFDDPIEIGA